MVALLRMFFQLFNDIFLALHVRVLRLETIFHIDTQLRLGQITDMPH